MLELIRHTSQAIPIGFIQSGSGHSGSEEQRWSGPALDCTAASAQTYNSKELLSGPRTSTPELPENGLHTANIPLMQSRYGERHQCDLDETVLVSFMPTNPSDLGPSLQKQTEILVTPSKEQEQGTYSTIARGDTNGNNDGSLSLYGPPIKRTTKARACHNNMLRSSASPGSMKRNCAS